MDVLYNFWRNGVTQNRAFTVSMTNRTRELPESHYHVLLRVEIREFFYHRRCNCHPQFLFSDLKKLYDMKILMRIWDSYRQTAECSVSVIIS